MTPANRSFLESLRETHDHFVNHGSLNPFPIQEVQRIYREEWDPTYTVQHWCGHCVAEMLKDVFRRMDTEIVKVKL